MSYAKGLNVMMLENKSNPELEIQGFLFNGFDTNLGDEAWIQNFVRILPAGSYKSSDFTNTVRFHDKSKITSDWKPQWEGVVNLVFDGRLYKREQNSRGAVKFVVPPGSISYLGELYYDMSCKTPLRHCFKFKDKFKKMKKWFAEKYPSHKKYFKKRLFTFH